MARRQVPLAQRRAQRTASGNLVVLAEQAGFQPVEQRELLVRLERGMVGHVVGDAHEFVERENGAAMARMDEPRRDREILVAVALAGAQCAMASLVMVPWPGSRPFHCPPLPRANCRAESSVNSM